LGKGKRFEGTDANVFMSIIDNNAESDHIWLSKSNAVSKNKSLFETGQCDEFKIQPSLKVERVQKIRIGHDNKGLASGWHLNKVEVIDPSNTQRCFMFEADRWLSKDEGDRQTDVFLYAVDQKNSNHVEVEVIHDEETDSEASLPIFSASSNDSKGGK
jgi:hypothetical protein